MNFQHLFWLSQSCGRQLLWQFLHQASNHKGDKVEMNIPASVRMTMVRILENLWGKKASLHCFRHAKKRHSYDQPPPPNHQKECKDSPNSPPLPSGRPCPQLDQSPRRRSCPHEGPRGSAGRRMKILKLFQPFRRPDRNLPDKAAQADRDIKFLCSGLELRQLSMGTPVISR